MKSFSVSDILS